MTGPPTDCAAGLIVAEGRVLLGRRSPDLASYPDVWDLFGGHREAGETIEACLARELHEELDVTPTAFAFLTAFPEPNPEQNGNCRYHVYEVTAWTGRGPRLRGPEHSEMRWFGLEEALVLDLALPDYRALLEASLA